MTGSAAPRPYVVASCAVSVDGCLDDRSPRRLVLSSEADLDRVDAVRASCDAILVGAGTVRADDPRLLVRSAARRQEREAGGLAPSPMRVVVSSGGDLDPAAAVFAPGAATLVYCVASRAGAARARLGAVATVVASGADAPLDLAQVFADLHGRGVRRLLVEGGQGVLTGLLGGGLADELHLVVAPVIVGDPAAPRLIGAGRFPPGPQGRAVLLATQQLGDVVLLRYALTRHGREPASPAGATG